MWTAAGSKSIRGVSSTECITPTNVWFQGINMDLSPVCPLSLPFPWPFTHSISPTLVCTHPGTSPTRRKQLQQTLPLSCLFYSVEESFYTSLGSYNYVEKALVSTPEYINPASPTRHKQLQQTLPLSSLFYSVEESFYTYFHGIL